MLIEFNFRLMRDAPLMLGFSMQIRAHSGVTGSAKLAHHQAFT